MVSNKNLYAFLTAYTRATCPAHLALIDLIILITFDEKYKLLFSALRSVGKLALFFLTRIRAGRPRNRGYCLVGILCLANVHVGLGAHPTPIQREPRSLSLGVNGPKYEAHCSPPPRELRLRGAVPPLTHRPFGILEAKKELCDTAMSSLLEPCNFVFHNPEYDNNIISKLVEIYKLVGCSNEIECDS